MLETKATAKQLSQGIKLRLGIPHVVRVVQGVSRVRLVGMFFELNKCFLLPTAMKGIRTIKTVYDQHPGSNLLIVGHTDTSGDPAFNLDLSLERSDAVAAFLTDAVDPWDAFFAESKPVKKRWGTREIQHMLSALPVGAAKGEEFYSGAPNGSLDGKTQASIRKFQKSEGLKEDGIAGPITRKALIKRYMSIDDTSLPAGIAITTHGCGENFPVKDTADGKRSPEDRRVELYFFDGPISPAPPGKTSAKGAPEPPLLAAQAQETLDVSAEPVAAGPFQYGVPVGGSSPWTANAVLRITAVDGSDERKFPMSQGIPVGVYRVFEFPDSIPGLKYKGFMEEGASSIQVFGAVELRRLIDPEDGVDHLPLPEQGEEQTELPPQPIPGAPPAASPADPDFDSDAVAVAARPDLPGVPISMA